MAYLPPMVSRDWACFQNCQSWLGQDHCSTLHALLSPSLWTSSIKKLFCIEAFSYLISLVPSSVIAWCLLGTCTIRIPLFGYSLSSCATCHASMPSLLDPLTWAASIWDCPIFYFWVIYYSTFERVLHLLPFYNMIYFMLTELTFPALKDLSIPPVCEIFVWFTLLMFIDDPAPTGDLRTIWPLLARIMFGLVLIRELSFMF